MGLLRIHIRISDHHRFFSTFPANHNHSFMIKRSRFIKSDLKEAICCTLVSLASIYFLRIFFSNKRVRERERAAIPATLMASDVSSSVQPDFESFSRLTMKQFMGTERPWLNLYGKRVRPVAPFGSMSSRPFNDPALIHRSLPDELLFEIFARADPYSLGRAACVCRKWRYTIRNPSLWQNACLKAWQLSGMMETYKVFKSIYDCSWRKMWIQRPRVRFDGLYVSRNAYLRVGVAEWTVTNPVHLVCYYRYIRFYPNGKLLYKVSSQRVKEATRCMHIRASKADCVYKGEFKLSEDQIDAAILYPGYRLTLLRIRARIRGTAQGANNRLDLLRLVTTGVNENEIKNHEGGVLGFVEGWPEDETHDPDVPAISHSRGLSPCVFVPFNEADTSVLNLPVDKMDYFVPG